MGHTPEQRVAASTLQLYTFVFRLAIAQAEAKSCPYPSDRTPPDATMKHVGAPSAWSRPSDLDKKESDGRDSPQEVVPHAHRCLVCAPECCEWDVISNSTVFYRISFCKTTHFLPLPLTVTFYLFMSQLNLPMHTMVPGSELTKEPFRWDQRLFGLVLRLPATQPYINTSSPFLSSADDTSIDAMCEVTGGEFLCSSA